MSGSWFVDFSFICASSISVKKYLKCIFKLSWSKNKKLRRVPLKHTICYTTIKCILVLLTDKRAKSSVFSLFKLFKTEHFCHNLEMKYVKVSFKKKNLKLQYLPEIIVVRYNNSLFLVLSNLLTNIFFTLINIRSFL